MSLDTSGDWAVVDDGQNVVYYVKLGEGNYASGVTVTNAQKSHKNPSGEELGLDVEFSDAGQLQRLITSYHLWVQKLGAIIPAMGDKIVDNASVSWTVRKSTPCDYDSSNTFQRYHVVCLKIG